MTVVVRTLKFQKGEIIFLNDLVAKAELRNESGFPRFTRTFDLGKILNSINYLRVTDLSYLNDQIYNTH